MYRAQHRCGSETGTEFAEYDRNGNIGEVYTEAKNGAAWETREGEESQRKKKSPGSSTRFRKRSGALVTSRKIVSNRENSALGAIFV